MHAEADAAGVICGLAIAVAACVVATAVPAGAGAAAQPPPHTVEHVQVASFDDTKLDGWVVRPKAVPAGAKVPVVLWSAPYFGQCNFYPPLIVTDASDYPQCHYATGDDPALWDNDDVAEAVPVNAMLAHGIAVGIFNVRGTGNSGGCFDWFGTPEQRDQYELVEWLGTRPWSNGNVAMMGLSYHGTTPWEAAIQNPPHLKTIVVAGIISDPYLFSHTPQGATFSTATAFAGNFVLRVSLTPPVNGPPEHFTVEHLPVAADRVCPEVARFLAEDGVGTASDARSADFWKERRLIDRFSRIKASVFLVDGFQDNYLSGHQVQANEVWNRVRAPKRMLVGQWAHQFPNFNTYNPRWPVRDWTARAAAWLDHWLKGGGSAAPREGIVDYQEGAYEDQDSPLTSTLDAPPPAWHATRSWPPAEASDEVLYLTKGKLSGAAGGGSVVFEASPQIGATGSPKQVLCPETGPRGGQTSITFLSERARSPVLVAGNPFAYLRLSSDLPGGIVAVHLFDLAPDFVCAGDDGVAHGARYWGAGAADLRFHKGTMTGEPFPVATPTPVRVDITDLAETLGPGHRLAVVVSRGDPIDRDGQPFYPMVTVHGDGGPRSSQLMLPVVSGSFGGGAPTVRYPPRPFLPR